MKLESRYTFPYPRSKVWNILLDPDVLSRCLPGCERFEQIGEEKYAVTVKLGVGAIKGTYTGTVEIVDKLPQTSYQLRGEGKGAPGWVKGEAAFELVERDGKTEVTAHTDVRIGGTIAGVGQRMIDGVSKMIAQQFFESLEKELAGQQVKHSFLSFIWGAFRTLIRLVIERLKGTRKK